MIEQWKEIKDFPNYEISNTCKLRNKLTGTIRTKKGTIYNNGKKKTAIPQRLAYIYFIGDVDRYDSIRVIDESKPVTIENLKVYSRAESLSGRIYKKYIRLSDGKTFYGINALNAEYNRHASSAIAIAQHNGWTYKGSYWKIKRLTYHEREKILNEKINARKNQ